MSPRKEVGLAKHGYLNKAPFHSESDGLFSGKVITYTISHLSSN